MEQVILLKLITKKIQLLIVIVLHQESNELRKRIENDCVWGSLRSCVLRPLYYDINYNSKKYLEYDINRQNNKHIIP